MEDLPDIPVYTIDELRQVLSKREMEILWYLTYGFPDKEIARRNGISNSTVRNHISSIYRKISIPDNLSPDRVAIQIARNAGFGYSPKA